MVYYLNNGDIRFTAYLPSILYIPVPQSGQDPLMAFLPFFIVTSFASFISFFALHFTQ